MIGWRRLRESWWHRDREVREDAKLQSTLVWKLWLDRRRSKYLAKDCRSSPQSCKGIDRNGAVETPPPVLAEGAIVQLAKVLLRAHPVAFDSGGDVRNDDGNGFSSETIRNRTFPARAADLPDRPNRSHSEEGPQPERGCV